MTDVSVTGFDFLVTDSEILDLIFLICSTSGSELRP